MVSRPRAKRGKADKAYSDANRRFIGESEQYQRSWMISKRGHYTLLNVERQGTPPAHRLDAYEFRIAVMPSASRGFSKSASRICRFIVVA